MQTGDADRAGTAGRRALALVTEDSESHAAPVARSDAKRQGDLLDEDAARRLTEEIRSVLTTVQERVDMLVNLIEDARDGQAHVALGYRSWTEYAEQEFGRTPLRLPAEDRKELVVRLAEMGMSTRAIAPVVGGSPRQTARDVAEGRVPNGTRDDHSSADRSASTNRTSTEEAPTAGPDDETYQGRDQEGTSVSPSRPPRAVTGRDGKEYVVRPKSKSRAEQDKEKEEVADESDRQQPARRSRTKVVAVMSKVVLSATDAAFAAEELRPEHFKRRKEEATRWARDLDSAIQSLQRLADLLKEQTE